MNKNWQFLLCNSTIIRKTFVFLHLMTHKIFLTLNPLIRKCLKLLQRNLFLWRRCNIILWKYSTEPWRQQRLITQAIRGFQCCQLWQFWNLVFFLGWIGNTAFFFIFFCRNFHTMQFSNIDNPEINVEKPKTTALVVATWTNLIFILLIIATFSVIFVVGLFWILLNKIIKESWNRRVLPYWNVKVLA